MAKAPKKPVYGKFLTSNELQTRAQAEAWAQKEKKSYKQADISIKIDITRTPSSGWKATLYSKV